LAVIAAVSVGLRLPFLSVPLITDEGGYAYIAHWMMRGLALYRDLWFDRPQGIFLVYGAQMALLGESTEAIRLGAALYNAATGLLLYGLTASLAGPLAGVAAAGLFAVSSAAPAIEGFTANGELYMNLLVVAALWLATSQRWFLAGVLLSLAVAVKPTSLLGVGLALPFLAIWGESWGRTSLLAIARRGALGMCGVALAALPFIAHGVSTDPQVYWYSLVGFRVQAHSAFSAGPALLGDLGQTAPTVLAALLPLWLLTAAGACLTWRTRTGAVGLAFLVGSGAGAAAGGHWFWHYYVGLMPPAALLGGVAIQRLLEGKHTLGRRSLHWVLGVGALATLVAVGFNARLVGIAPGETSWRIYRRPAYLASSEIAAYIRGQTTESETVYAAFAQADLYHLSGRRSAGRHLYWTEINRVPDALEEVLATLDDPIRRPAYVIRIDDELEAPGRAAPFWERVGRFYVPEHAVQGFTIYRARETAPK